MSRANHLILTLSALLLLGAPLLFSGCSDPQTAQGGSAEPATAVKVQLPKTEDDLKKRIDDVLEFTERRYLNTRDHAAWQIMHGLLAYPHKLMIHYDTSGEPKPALDWLLKGGELRGFTLVPRGEGRLDSLLEGGSKTGQGHDDQWLAILAQAGLKWDDPLVYRGTTYKIGDLVTAAQYGVFEGAECSWTLIGLTAYPEHVSFEDTWIVTPKDLGRPTGEGSKQEKGEEWSIHRIVKMEANQSAEQLNQSACGGSHRLIGLTMALERYKQHLRNKGESLQFDPKDKGKEGWLAAERQIQRAIQIMQEFQQPDGAFSDRYLDRRSTSSQISRRINTSGHTLEFLSLALPPQRLKEDWVVKAAVHVCELFERTADVPVECGSLYHAAHALLIYRDRRWGRE